MAPLLVAGLACGALFLLCGLAYLAGRSLVTGADPVRDWAAAGIGRQHQPEQPAVRPIEEIVADLCRLGARFHALDPHTSFIKAEAVRSGYDHALADCCTALGLTHLLEVLTPGPELDAERGRVEELLASSGVRFPHAA